MAQFGSLAPRTADDDLLQLYTDPMGSVSGAEPNRKRPNWMMEPDLLSTQLGQLPEGVGLDETGRPFYRDTGEPLTVVPRPGMLPIAKTPEGYTFAKPKIFDIASYLIGGPVKMGPGEEALGAGAIIKRGAANKKLGLEGGVAATEVPQERPKPPGAPTQPVAETPPVAPPSPGAEPSINWNRERTQLGGAAVGNRTVMDVPVDALDAAHKATDPGMYVATPKKSVMEHMAAGNEISLPEVHVERTDYPSNWWRLGYTNGRNRVAAARELGAKTIPVVVEPGHEEQLRQLLELHDPTSFGRLGGQGAMPQLAERYPGTVPPTLKYKGTNKPVPLEDVPAGDELERRLALPKKDATAVFQGKTESPEAKQLAKVRLGMKPDIEAGNYQPYFDPAKRTDVDPSTYGDYHDTATNLMKTAASRADYDLLANNPEAVKRLNEAYARGLKQKDAAGNWYFMKQLHDEFVKEYGQELGPKMFKERFADPMAATTGGMDPTSNLLMSYYGNYLKSKGLEVPPSHQMPYPIGGQYAGSNMGHFEDMIMKGEGIDPIANPKRYNFSGNFLGRSQPATLDEQMSGLWDPKMQMPPKGSYGHFEQVLRSLAAHHGVDPRYFQEVAWAGTKDINTPGGYAAKPMISHVNDAIERTHRVTGMPRQEIVRRGLVRGEIPIYGTGGAGAAASFGSLSPRRDE